MIAEAQAAANHVATVAAELTFSDIKELLAWLNALLLPIGAFIMKIERRLAATKEWQTAHDILDTTRFSAHEQRVNDLINRIEGLPVATAGLHQAKGNA